MRSRGPSCACGTSEWARAVRLSCACGTLSASGIEGRNSTVPEAQVDGAGGATRRCRRRNSTVSEAQLGRAGGCRAYSRRVGVWNTFCRRATTSRYSVRSPAARPPTSSTSTRRTTPVVTLSPTATITSAATGGDSVAMSAAAARGCARRAGRDRRDLREHRRQRAGAAAAADGRGLRAGQFLAQIVVNLNAKGRQLGKGFATSHEYLLAYARDVRRCVLDASSPDAVDPADFPLESPDGRRYRHLPLRNTNKKFNPVTARTMHFPVYGDPSGCVSAAPSRGPGRSRSSRCSRRPPGRVAVVRAPDRAASGRPGVPGDQGGRGARRRVPAGLVARDN